MRLVRDKHYVQTIFSIIFPPFSFFFLLQAKAEEELQETQGQIDSLLNELSSLNQPTRGVGSVATGASLASSLSTPEGAVMSHTEMLQVRISQLYEADFDLYILKT